MILKGGNAIANDLVFITNQLQNPDVIKTLNIPLEFVCFAIAEGEMFTHQRSKETFVTNERVKNVKRFANDVVYGTVYVLSDFDYYIRNLDAYHMCSLSALRKNHQFDVHHRILTTVTPIYFSTIEELARIKYREGKPIDAHMYIGNIKHPKIRKRIYNIRSYRVIDGVDAKHIKQRIREVLSNE